MDIRGEDWTGPIGKAWASEWARTDRSFAPLTERLTAATVAALDDRASGGERNDAALRLIDVGCGAGETAIAVARARPDVQVTGLDLAPDLLEAARMRADGVENCRFVEGDAAAWQDGQRFDAAMSRHGVMFFGDPEAAFAHLRTLMMPGAPLIFTCFRAREENEWARDLAQLLAGPPPADPHVPGPFAFADAERVGRILHEAGWTDARTEAVDYDYVAGEGDDPVADAATFFARIGPAAPAIRALDAAERERFDAQLTTMLARHVEGNRVRYRAAAWLWRAAA